MAGNEFVGFSNATFLSEKSCADQNFAIGYFLKEHGVFPPGIVYFRVFLFSKELVGLHISKHSISNLNGLCSVLFIISNFIKMQQGSLNMVFRH